MRLHLAQEFVHQPDLPVGVRAPAVGQQGIRFVQHQDGVEVAGFLESAGEVALVVAYIPAEQVGGAAGERLALPAFREVADERGLAGAGRPGEQEAHAPGAAGHDPVGEFDQVAVGAQQFRVVAGRRRRRGRRSAAA